MHDSRKLPPSAAALDSREASLRIIGSGAMAERIRSYPWHDTSIGPIQLWPETLVANVNLILNSPLALSLFWGPELIFIGNDATSRIGSRSHAETLGSTAATIWGANWPLAQHRFEAVLATGTPCHEESVITILPLQGKDREVFVDYSLSPVYDQGSVVAVFRMVEDTTESVLAMRALAESNERLRMALSAGNGFGVWETSIQSGIIFGDEIIARLFGLDPAAAAAGIPRLLYENTLHPDDIASLNDAAFDCILTGKPYNAVYRVKAADGSFRSVRTLGRCIYDEQGHASHLTGLTTEVDAQPSIQPATALLDLFRGPQWDLLPFHVRSFVAALLYFMTDDPEKVTLQVIPGPDSTQIAISASADDLGKLIGKQGRNVRAIRTLLLAVNKTSPDRYSIDIQDGKRTQA